jgi:hypothetical protein
VRGEEGGNSLRVRQRTVTFELIGDAGCAHRVISDARFDGCLARWMRLINLSRLVSQRCCPSPVDPLTQSKIDPRQHRKLKVFKASTYKKVGMERVPR